MKKRKIAFSTKAIAIHGVLAALILIFYAIPINFVGLQIVFLPLIAVSVSALYLGFWHGVLSGLFMGLVSCVGSLIMPGSPLSLLFRYPWISVIPKAAFPAVCYGISALMKKAVKNPVPADFVGSLAGALTNTGLTIGFILLFYNGVSLSVEEQSIIVSPAVIFPLLSVNAVIEAILTALITPTVVFALKKAIPNPLEPFSRKKKPAPASETAQVADTAEVSETQNEEEKIESETAEENAENDEGRSERNS